MSLVILHKDIRILPQLIMGLGPRNLNRVGMGRITAKSYILGPPEVVNLHYVIRYSRQKYCIDSINRF